MDETGKPRRGRPPTGVTPKRIIRIGPVWDELADLAKRHGERMAVVVTRALTREARMLRTAMERSHDKEASDG